MFFFLRVKYPFHLRAEKPILRSIITGFYKNGLEKVKLKITKRITLEIDYKNKDKYINIILCYFPSFLYAKLVILA